MLRGKHLTLRPILEADLDAVYAAHLDIRNRGAFFPLGVQSESAFKRAFADHGLWQRDEGYLLMITPEHEIAGHIEFFKPVIYWDAFELSYQLYDERFAGRGYTTEAVRLVVDYLFAVKKQDRIQLDIAPENAASRRIAEKCGFTLEGTARSAMYNGGRNQDLLIYSLLRSDPRPWLACAATTEAESMVGHSPMGGEPHAPTHASRGLRGRAGRPDRLRRARRGQPRGRRRHDQCGSHHDTEPDSGTRSQHDARGSNVDESGGWRGDRHRRGRGRRRDGLSAARGLPAPRWQPSGDPAGPAGAGDRTGEP
jgi:ribosomal-protein-alanine N-acetyltransferase